MPKSLKEMREDIDAIDENIHKLLMKRAEIVSEVGKYKEALNKGVKGANNIRVDREFDILKSLLFRHQGIFPINSIIRIWREIISASLRLEGEFSVVSYTKKGDLEILKLIEEHYGTYSKLEMVGSPFQALKKVDDGKATIAVLSLLPDNENRYWWTNISSKLKVITRLPMMKDLAVANADAVVLSKSEYTPTNSDASLIKFETKKSMSKTSFKSAVLAMGFKWNNFEGSSTIETGRIVHLVSVDEYVSFDDSRIKSILEKYPQIVGVELLGWYPVIR